MGGTKARPFQNILVNEELYVKIRAAFELGSGCIRLQVAKVDTQAKKIIEVLFKHVLHVDFAKDLIITDTQSFSQEIMDKTIHLLLQLKTMADVCCPHEYSGIATEAFRRSKNALEFVKRIANEVGISIKIATHQEEAIYGFYSALSLSNLSHDRLICWDSGAGSFQVTALNDEKPIMFLGQFGRIPVQHYIVNALQMRDFSKTHSPNPVTKNEALLAIDYIKNQLQACPEPLLKKLKCPNAIVISIGAHPKLVPVGVKYSPDDIKKHLFENLNKADSDFTEEEPAFIVSDLILAYSIMSTLGIGTAERFSTKYSGNTSGILIDSDLYSETLCAKHLSSIQK